MSDQGMLTSIDGRMLAEAFSPEYQSAAMSAGDTTARLLARRQWTERFSVQVGPQRVLIPARLHWGAPFIVALIGEYVVEILDDIAAALTPDLTRTIGAFIVGNEAYWNTTKRRVTSYWNVYYRARWLNEYGRAERRDEFVGFRLIQQLETAAFRSAPTANE